MVVVTVVAMLLLNLYVRRTRMGRAMRASAQDKRTSALMGVNVNKVIALTFLIGSAMGALAGGLYGGVYHAAWPLMGFNPGLKAFIAAVLGGIGNIPGAFLGGLLLGVIEALGSAYLPMGSQYRDAFAFVILILILSFRPSGLLGSTVVAEGLAWPASATSARPTTRPARRLPHEAQPDRRRPRRETDPARSQRVLLGVLLAIAVILPFLVASDRWITLMTVVVIYVVLASGLNIVVGFTGLLDLGYVAFYAIGAYYTAIIFNQVLKAKYGVDIDAYWWLMWVNLLVGGLLAAVAGVLIGYPTLRVRGDYLAIMTLGFGEIIRIVAINWVGLTRGPSGISGIPKPAFFGFRVQHAAEPLLPRSRPGAALAVDDLADRALAHRPRLDGDPRGRGRGRGDGHPHLALQAAVLRHGGVLRRRHGRVLRALPQLHLAEQLHAHGVVPHPEPGGARRHGQHRRPRARRDHLDRPAGVAARLPLRTGPPGDARDRHGAGPGAPHGLPPAGPARLRCA